ncbi:hypothetical protein ACKTEK_05005 [Tepidamorphus sp. 3E244]|uniref:hypothetical protein n=1 Tax=Tepidamorphus sp. 3E244 TaxID=3385498 RepID=UPI0038FCCE57
MTKIDKSEITRRKLLQRVAVGGAFAFIPVLPEKWVKPAIDMIVVPAHAQAVSGPSPSASTGAVPPTPSASPGAIPPSPSSSSTVSPD